MVKTCPNCGKKLAGKAALKQHMSAVHSVKIITKQPKQRRRTANGDQRMSTGTDVLTTFRVRSGMTVGELLLNSKLNPHSFVNSRWFAESQLWSRWKPTALKLEVIASGAMTTFGSILIGWVADPSYNVGSGFQTVSRIGALKHKINIRLNESKTFNIPLTMARAWYDREGSPEVSSHGSLIAAVLSEPGGFSGFLSVTLDLHWSMSFDGPELPFEDIPTETIIKPDSGWYNLFTTSDGSFDTRYLTFKMHAGGDMVPFSMARLGVIYTPYGSTSVNYADANGANKKCDFLSRVRGYGVPGLVLHATQAEAEAYQKTGERGRLLTYNAEGEYTTPNIPMFKEKSVVKGCAPSSEEELGVLPQTEDSLSEQVLMLATLVRNLTVKVDELSKKEIFREDASFEELS